MDKYLGLGVWWVEWETYGVTGGSVAIPANELAWESQYRTKVQVYDLAGNASGWGSWVEFRPHDTTVPTAPGTPDLVAGSDSGKSNTDNITNDKTPTFSWAASSDLHSGLDLYEYRLGTTGSWVSTGNGTTASVTLPSLSDGAYTIYVRAKDKAGNPSAASSGLTFTIDTAAPSARAPSAPSGDVGMLTPAVTWTAGTDIWKSDVYVDKYLGLGVWWVEWETYGVTGGSVAIPANELAWESQYRTKVQVYDLAGNASGWGSWVEFRPHDSTVPTVPGTPDLAAASDSGKSNTDNITNDKTPTFTWATSSDLHSGLDLYEYRLGTTGSWVSTGNGTTASVTLPSLADGAYTIYVRAKDKAGNPSAASSGLTFTIDTAAPSARAPSAPSGDVGMLTPAVTWTAGTDIWKSDVYVDKYLGLGVWWVEWETYGVTGGSVAIPANELAWESQYRTKVQVYDLAGNASGWGSWVEFRPHDSTVPTAPGTPDLVAGSDSGKSNTDNITNDKTPTFSWAASSDLHSGLDLYEYRLGTTGSWVSTGNGTTASVTLPSLSDGAYTIYVRAKDKAGNPSAASSGLTFTIDTAPPLPPTLLSPAEGQQVTTNTPALSWQSVHGAWKYEVLVREDQFPWSDSRSSPQTTATSWTVPSTSSLGYKDWGWQVKVWDVAGNESVFGANGVGGAWGHFKGTPSPLSLVGTAYNWTELDHLGNASVSGSLNGSLDQKLYRLVPDASGKAVFDTDTPGSDLDTLLAVYNASGRPLAWNDNQGVLSWDPLNPSDSRVEVNLTAGQTYYVLVSGKSGSTGTFTLNVDAANAALTTVNLAANVGDGKVTGQAISPAGEGDYFKVVAPANTAGGLKVTVDSRSTTLNAKVTVWEENLGWFGLGIGKTTILKKYAQGVGVNGDPSVFIGASPGFTYYICVTGTNGSTGTYDLYVDFSTDNLPDSLDNARLVGPNAQVPAKIDTAGDKDVVAINARGGITYTLTVGSEGTGSVAGGSARVLNSGKSVVTSSTWTRGTSREITFTPTVDGVFYIEFAASSSTALGTYHFEITPSQVEPPDGVWGSMWTGLKDWANDCISDPQEPKKPLFFFDASAAFGGGVQFPYTFAVEGHLVEAGVTVAFDLADLAGITLDAAEHYTTVWIMGSIAGPGFNLEAGVKLDKDALKLQWGLFSAGLGIMTLDLVDVNKDGFVDANDDPAKWSFDAPSLDIGVGPISINLSDPLGPSVSLDSDKWKLCIDVGASLFEISIPILRADVPTSLLFGPMTGLLQGTMSGQDFLGSMYGAVTSFFMPPRNINLLGFDLSSSYSSDGRAFDNIQMTATASSSLKAVTSKVPPAPRGQVLTQADLRPVAEAAIAQWTDAGLSKSLIQRLQQVHFVMADLPGSELGRATSDTIYIDTDAAGYAWFIAPSPRRNEEFVPASRGVQLQAVDRRAVDRIDLLTVVSHELGHIAGLDDLAGSDDGVMNGRLRPGVRRIADVDAVFARGEWFNS